MADLKRAKEIMDWLWKQMHRGNLKMPADQLIFEGEHDLVYLYNTGFVDTDKFSLDKWIQAFRESRQRDGSYSLTHEQWLDKVTYRYNEKVEAPFDIMAIREGEWTESEWKDFVKEKIMPETIFTYDQFLKGFEEGKKAGKLKNGMVIVTQELKQTWLQAINKNPSPQRHRALAVHRIRQHENFESPSGMQKSKGAAKRPVVTEQEKTKYDKSPDRQKQMTGKLSDLLSGSKK